MNESVAEKIELLRELVDSNELPARDREMLIEHLDRIDRPMRVAVYGLDTATTAHLVNFLAAERLLPTDGGAGVPVRVRHAKSKAVQAKLTTGEAEWHDIEDLPTLLDTAQHVTIGAPLQALRKLSIIRCVSQDMDALHVAAERNVAATDLSFLCADGFGSEEERFWMALPEAVRDKGFLVVPAGAEVPARARQLLAGVIVADVKAAIDARAAPGGLDRAAFEAAGGKTLVTTIRRELQWTEQALMDAAAVIIYRAANARPKSEVSAATVADVPVAEAPESHSAAGSDGRPSIAELLGPVDLSSPDAFEPTGESDMASAFTDDEPAEPGDIDMAEPVSRRPDDFAAE